MCWGAGGDAPQPQMTQGPNNGLGVVWPRACPEQSGAQVEALYRHGCFAIIHSKAESMRHNACV